ncbi:MAG TPA: Ger(x)C family spore germination protein [Clostridia bacterium]
MKTVTKCFITAIVFMSLLLQTGCWDQKQFEEIGFILQMGLETGKHGKMLLSLTTPVVSPEAEKKAELLCTSSEKLIRSSRDMIRNSSGKLLQGGKIQIIYFSKELAEKGELEEFFDVYFRDPENPLLANVVIVDGSPKEMMELSLDFKSKPRPAMYVNQLLMDARRRASAPEMRVYNFSILKWSKTIDPVTPLVGYNKEAVNVEGSALFSGDKMVGVIDTDQTMLLNALMGKSGGEYTYRDSELDKSDQKIKKGAVISFKNTKPKIKIDTNDSSPVINIRLDINALLDEYSGIQNLDIEENKEKLEEIFSESIRTDILKLLKQLQSVDSDPIGFGEILRSTQNKYWKLIDWKKVYGEAVLNVDVKLNIESYGTLK